MKFLLGTKLGMSQMFDEKGKVIPVTLIEAGPCYVTQIKTQEKDGYEAVQLGFGKPPKKQSKAVAGHVKKAGKEARVLRETREAAIEKELKVGDTCDVTLFEAGEKVKIAGISKGKGFAGAVKRWGFHGRPASHGTKHEERTLGSTGSMYPQRVTKGRKMPGRMGAERVTVKNLIIAKVDPGKHVLAVKGAVPGRKGTLVEIRG